MTFTVYSVVINHTVCGSTVAFVSLLVTLISLVWSQIKCYGVMI